MRVRMTLDVSDYARYVIAQYARRSDGASSRVRRASRAQVRKFVFGALEMAVREQASALRSRQATTAQRLKDGRTDEPEVLMPPDERQTLLNF